MISKNIEFPEKYVSYVLVPLVRSLPFKFFFFHPWGCGGEGEGTEQHSLGENQLRVTSPDPAPVPAAWSRGFTPRDSLSSCLDPITQVLVKHTIRCGRGNVNTLSSPHTS